LSVTVFLPLMLNISVCPATWMLLLNIRILVIYHYPNEDMIRVSLGTRNLEKTLRVLLFVYCVDITFIWSPCISAIIDIRLQLLLRKVCFDVLNFEN